MIEPEKGVREPVRQIYRCDGSLAQVSSVRVPRVLTQHRLQWRTRPLAPNLLPPALRKLEATCGL